MKDIIRSITLNEDVTLVSVYNVPSDTGLLASYFSDIAGRGVNVDMISQTAPLGGNISYSFTVPDNQLVRVLELSAKYNALTPDRRLEISSGNCKLSFFGEDMKTTPGVAAKVFSVFAQAGMELKLITTSEIDISVLVDKSIAEQCVELFEGMGFSITHMKP